MLDRYILDDIDATSAALNLVMEICNQTRCNECPFFGGDRNASVSNDTPITDSCCFYDYDLFPPYTWEL